MNSHDEPLFGFSDKERLEYETTLLRLLVAADIESYLNHAELQAKDLATRVGKSKAWISKLLSGRQNSTLDTLAETAWALGARWSVRLTAAERPGTPAESDPPPPAWAMAVQITSQQVTQHLVPYIPNLVSNVTVGITPIGLTDVPFSAAGGWTIIANSVSKIYNPYDNLYKEGATAKYVGRAESSATQTNIDLSANTEMSWA
jgi:transcriptional regulator with XRE-family HTH domain